MKQEQKTGAEAPGTTAFRPLRIATELGQFAFMQFIEGPFGFLEEEEAEEGDDQAGYTKDLEKDAVGGSYYLWGWLTSTAHPHRQKAENCEVSHGTNVSVSAHQTGHLTGDATFDKWDQGKCCALAGLHEEGREHRDRHGYDDSGGAGEGTGFDHAHHQVAHSQTSGEEAHGVFPATDFVGDQTSGGTGDQVHEGKARRQDARSGFRKIEGGFKECWQH